MGLVEIVISMLFMALAVCIAFGILTYVIFGVIFAFALTGRFARSVYLRESHGIWSMVTGSGWFLLLGGMDLAYNSSDPLAPLGILMILCSFGVWIYAHTLLQKELTEE